MTVWITPVTQFILDELHSDQQIVNMTDNQFYTGLLRTPISLSPPHYTRVGIKYNRDTTDNDFFSDIRDFSITNLTVTVQVWSAYGDNDNHCRMIVDKIVDLFGKNRKKVTENYQIYINSISSVIEESDSKWIGNIEMKVVYLKPITFSS